MEGSASPQGGDQNYNNDADYGEYDESMDTGADGGNLGEGDEYAEGDEQQGYDDEGGGGEDMYDEEGYDDEYEQGEGGEYDDEYEGEYYDEYDDEQQGEEEYYDDQYDQNMSSSSSSSSSSSNGSETSPKLVIKALPTMRFSLGGNTYSSQEPQQQQQHSDTKKLPNLKFTLTMPPPGQQQQQQQQPFQHRGPGRPRLGRPPGPKPKPKSYPFPVIGADGRDRKSLGNAKIVLACDMEGNVIKEYLTGKLAAFDCKVSQSDVSMCCRGIKDSASGFKFRFKEAKHVLPDKNMKMLKGYAIEEVKVGTDPAAAGDGGLSLRPTKLRHNREASASLMANTKTQKTNKEREMEKKNKLKEIQQIKVRKWTKQLVSMKNCPFQVIKWVPKGTASLALRDHLQKQQAKFKKKGLRLL